MIVFALSYWFLQFLGSIFGLERGADLVIYFSIIFLLYCVLILFNKNEKTNIRLTNLIREFSIFHSPNFDKNFQTTLVIPVFNEEKIISDTIKQIFAKNPEFAIIAIDDGSSDNTLEVLQNLEKFFPNLRVLSHSQNLGQWAALETWFSYIRKWKIKTDFIVTFDADGQMDVDDILNLQKILQKNPEIEVVLGSRFLGISPQNMPFFRKIILKIWIIFTRFLSWIRLTDVHNWFRIFRASIISKIKISIDGMGHASEILDIIAEEKIIFREAPVKIKYTDYSLHKGQKSSNSIKIALKMMLRKFF